jgi:hypothetical protein
VGIAVVGCLDVVAIQLLVRHLRTVDPRQATGLSVGVMAGRIVVKAALLGAAVVWPEWLSLLGVAIGAVAYDTVLATYGSVSAARASFGISPDGR